MMRRTPYVGIGEYSRYAMGLNINTEWGVNVIHHGGSMLGYKSDMMFLPEHRVGAVLLAKRYQNADLGELTFRHRQGRTYVSTGEFEGEVASRENNDGTLSMVYLGPEWLGFPLVVGKQDGRRTLTVRDAQHEYVFVEVK